MQRDDEVKKNDAFQLNNGFDEGYVLFGNNANDFSYRSKSRRTSLMRRARQLRATAIPKRATKAESLRVGEATSDNAIDNKITLTAEERIQRRWENRIDSVSYAMGLDVAMRLEQQFDKFNHERIIQAIDDYYSGSRLFLSNKQRIDAINTYNNLLAPKFKMDKDNKRW